MINFLPRDTRISEAGQGFSALGEAVGNLTGGLIANKVSQVKARNALESFGVDPIQADKLSRLPFAQRNKMISDVAERKGYTAAGSGSQEGPTTMQNLGALKSMQMMQQPSIQSQPAMQPQQVRAPDVMNPLQAGQQAQQGINNFQQAQAMGQPGGQLQAAMGGLNALKQADLSQRLGYGAPNVQQQQQAQQRQPGQFPSAATATGQPVQLPSEGRTPKAPMDESGIPAQFRGMGLNSYKKPNLLTGPNRTEAQLKAEEEAHYENQVKAKKHVNDKENKKVQEIYKEYDKAKKELPLLKQLSDLNKSGKIQFSKISGANWLGQAVEFIGLGEKEGTREAQNLLAGLSREVKAELGVAGSSASRQEKLNKHIKEAEKSVARKDALDNIIDENSGWTPNNIDRLVNQRAQINERQARSSEQKPEEVLEEEPEKSSMWAQAFAPVIRAAESLAGLPGDISSLAARGIQAVTIPQVSQNSTLAAIAANPVGTGSIRENVTKQFTGELFEPRSPAGEMYQNILGAAISLAVPGGGAAKILQRTAKAAAAVIGGKLVGGAVKAIGGNPIDQALGEAIATGVFMGSQFRNLVEKAKTVAYTEADVIANASRVSFSTKNLAKNITKMHHKISSRDMQGKEFLQKRLTGLVDIANKPTATVRELWDASKDINSHWADAPQGIISYMSELSKEVQAPLYEYTKVNKAWADSWPKAQSLHAGLAESRKVANIIRENKAFTEIPWVGRWIKASKGIHAQVAELALLATSSKAAKKLFSQFYARVLIQDFVGAENKARSIERLRSQQ